MKKVVVCCVFITLVFVSNGAYSRCIQNNNELLNLVGLDSASGVVYATTTSSSNECSCSHVRFKPENTDTKMALSVLLAARMAGKEVRIDLIDASDCNSAYRVYLE